MSDIIIPEELLEIIKEIVAYEELEQEISISDQIGERLYINPPNYDQQKEDENSWKIEIQI